MIPHDDVIKIKTGLIYARVSVLKTVSLGKVAMSQEGPTRPATLTTRLLSDVHQIINVSQNPENPSVTATSSGSTATVSPPVTSVQNSEPVHVVLRLSTTTVPSTSTTSVIHSPTPSFFENSPSNFEVRRFYLLGFVFSCCTKVSVSSRASNPRRFLFMKFFFNSGVVLARVLPVLFYLWPF